MSQTWTAIKCVPTHLTESWIFPPHPTQSRWQSLFLPVIGEPYRLCSLNDYRTLIICECVYRVFHINVHSITLCNIYVVQYPVGYLVCSLVHIFLVQRSFNWVYISLKYFMLIFLIIIQLTILSFFSRFISVHQFYRTMKSSVTSTASLSLHLSPPYFIFVYFWTITLTEYFSFG